MPTTARRRAPTTSSSARGSGVVGDNPGDATGAALAAGVSVASDGSIGTSRGAAGADPLSAPRLPRRSDESRFRRPAQNVRRSRRPLAGASRRPRQRPVPERRAATALNGRFAPSSSAGSTVLASSSRGVGPAPALADPSRDEASARRAVPGRRRHRRVSSGRLGRKPIRQSRSMFFRCYRLVERGIREISVAFATRGSCRCREDPGTHGQSHRRRAAFRGQTARHRLQDVGNLRRVALGDLGKRRRAANESARARSAVALSPVVSTTSHETRSNPALSKKARTTASSCRPKGWCRTAGSRAGKNVLIDFVRDARDGILGRAIPKR